MNLKRIFSKTSVMNLLSLSIGIVACVIILLFVKYESSYDKFHDKSNQIYRLRFIDSKNGKIEQDGAAASPPMGSTFTEKLPEIKQFVRFFNQREVIVDVENRKFEEKNVCYVDSNYFEVFSNKLVMGSIEECLSKPNTTVISESYAKKYFGNENPIGKTIKINGEIFDVTGVYEDMPANSHFHLNILLSFTTPTWLTKWHSDTWDMLFTYTYFLIDEKANISELEKKATEIANNHKPESYKDNQWEIRFQPLEDIHLHTDFRGGFEEGGNATMNTILTIAAFIILILAWLNYVSMSSAQSLDRAKEVGIKKVVGFYRTYLMRSFLVESFILNLVAVLIAIGITFLVKPYFENLLGVEMSFKYWSLGFVNLLFLVFIVGAFLSGLYPALVMSSFNPVQVLKGKIGVSAGKIGFRKVLLGFQFAISALLILITLVIFLQTKSMLNRGLGIDISNTLVLKGGNLQDNDSVFVSKIESFKQALMQYPEVISTSNSNSLPANTGFSDGVHSDIQQPEEKHQFRISYVDYNFLSGFNLKPIEGRLFSKDFPSDKNAAIISKSAVAALGFDNAKDALNHKTNRDFGDKNKEIIGVVDDFQLGSWKDQSSPMIFYLNPQEKTYFVVKLARPVSIQIINKIENTWKDYFGDEIFRYFDLQESYQALYKNDVRNSKVLALFAILGIFVACIGLWGLAHFTITNRTKEIGVRKVIGFTAVNIVEMINFEFIKIVFISSLIATPLAWWLSQKWLQDFASKINMAWWFAFIPFTAIALITIFTISFYTIKTALANPSEAIRDE